MPNTTGRAQPLSVLPVNRYHKSDSQAGVAFRLDRISMRDLTYTLKIGRSEAKVVLSQLKGRKIRKWSDLLRLEGISRGVFEKLRRCGIGPDDNRFAILDVQPAKDYIFSHKPFDLKVSFVNPAKRKLSFVSVRVLWKGKPFIVEQRISSGEAQRGFLNVKFGKDQTLPPGPAAFFVDLFDKDGGQSSFKVTCAVLPSNPLSMGLAPSTYYVTGSYSLRGYYDSGHDTYVTVVRLSIYNGNSAAVSMTRNLQWEFWDGGIGGSLKESGSYTFGYEISVPAYGTWSATLIFTSPNGSGIYNTYDDKEDMTVRIKMATSGGTEISDTITARVMGGFGVDIVRVASDTFVGQEYTDLYDAVEVTRSIYEARDIAFRGVGRYHIDDADAGSYGEINSADECYDLFDDWSADSGGNYIDVFVAHDFVGTGFDGLAGDIPGPKSHSGRRSGVAVDKTGYVDGSGTKRLSVDYLGMLIGHEVGHYLGLSHLSVAGNLLHPSSGTYDTDLTYDQYRTIMNYGWVYIA